MQRAVLARDVHLLDEVAVLHHAGKLREPAQRHFAPLAAHLGAAHDVGQQAGEFVHHGLIGGQIWRLAEIEGTPAEIGGDHAGFHDLDPNAQRFEFIMERFRQPFHREFRAVIQASKWKSHAPPIEEIFTITPLPCARMLGSTALVTSKSPITLVSN